MVPHSGWGLGFDFVGKGVYFLIIASEGRALIFILLRLHSTVDRPLEPAKKMCQAKRTQGIQGGRKISV